MLKTLLDRRTLCALDPRGTCPWRWGRCNGAIATDCAVSDRSRLYFAGGNHGENMKSTQSPKREAGWSSPNVIYNPSYRERTSNYLITQRSYIYPHPARSFPTASPCFRNLLRCLVSREERHVIPPIYVLTFDTFDSPRA